jgi:hypothetical protein
MNPISKDDLRYKEAEKRVKKIKNFYVFAFVYFAVNIFILIMNYRQIRSVVFPSFVVFILYCFFFFHQFFYFLCFPVSS